MGKFTKSRTCFSWVWWYKLSPKQNTKNEHKTKNRISFIFTDSICWFLGFLFFETGLLSSPGCPGTRYIDQVGFELRHLSTCFCFLGARIKDMNDNSQSRCCFMRNICNFTRDNSNIIYKPVASGLQFNC